MRSLLKIHIKNIDHFTLLFFVCTFIIDDVNATFVRFIQYKYLQYNNVCTNTSYNNITDFVVQWNTGSIAS